MTFRHSGGAILAVVLWAGASAAQTSLPSVSSLNPPTIQAGGGGFNLTVNGANFQNGAYVLWSGYALQASFQNSS